MKTLAALSLFTLAPALLTPGSARAQEVQPPPLEQEVALANPVQMPEPYQPPPDPYETEADPSQIDWPQDVAAEEATVDSYDDGYDPQAYAQFQDELSPYGNWIDDGTYGRVWVPTASLVGTDFTPYYSGGHWLLTEFGWTWLSDWSWGWAPFHYGRWIIVSGFGWSWVPGTIWGPAWVTWRFGDGYVGWAALPPRGVSVTVTYGHRSPWRFTRAGDLSAPRLRCLPMRDTKGMFHRTTNVANDRVLTRGATTVHINAGPRYIPNAAPARLKAVAPHAFPQRAILPHPGANMSVRPWIRAASTGGTPSNGGTPTRGGAPMRGGTPMRGGGNMDAGHAYGRSFPGHVSSSPPSSSPPSSSPPPSPPPRIYNAPRPLAPSPGGVYGTAPPRTFGPATHPNNQAFANTGLRIYDVAPAGNPPRTSNAPATYGEPHTFGAQPDNSPARVYNPPPRTFATPPAVNPTRSFGSSPTGATNPPPRTFAAPQRPFSPPVQPSRQTFAPPQTHAAPQMNPAPQRSFSAPAAGGFGSGGGMHFGGSRRR